MKWRSKMLAGIDKIGREGLVNEIINVLDQWPERERSVFSQAHYQGKNAETISSSLQIDVRDVQRILKQCDRQLHISLRALRKGICETPLISAANTARPAA